MRARINKRDGIRIRFSSSVFPLDFDELTTRIELGDIIRVITNRILIRFLLFKFIITMLDQIKKKNNIVPCHVSEFVCVYYSF